MRHESHFAARLVVVAWLTCALSACASQMQDERTSLRLGDSGSGVESLHEYLTRFGYFPNAELAARHPDWIPAVPESPRKRDVFDESTQEAVYALQAQMGLRASGVVDAETWQLIDLPRCGNPDQVRSGDKWALLRRRDSPAIERWPSNQVTWSYDNSRQPAGPSAGEAGARVNEAVFAWTSNSGYELSYTSNPFNADILVRWDDLGDGTVLGRADASFDSDSGATLNQVEILLNNNPTKAWSYGDPAGRIDFQSVVTHELGHALGLKHSSVESLVGPRTPVMAPGIAEGQTRQLLTVDDVQAARAQSPGRLPMNGPLGRDDCSSFVASLDGPVYATGGDSTQYGLQVFQLGLGNSWTSLGGEAVELAASTRAEGVSPLWAINASGQVFRRNDSDWERVDGSASQIAAANYEVWALGFDAVRGADHEIFRWSRDSQTWSHVLPGYVASDIAVISPTADDRNQIEVWFNNEAGQIFRVQLGIGDPDDGDVQDMPEIPGGAGRLTGGADGSVFAYQRGLFPPVFVWAEQAEVVHDGSTEPATKEWLPLPGVFANLITSDVSGALYYVGIDGFQYTPRAPLP